MHGKLLAFSWRRDAFPSRRQSVFSPCRVQTRQLSRTRSPRFLHTRRVHMCSLGVLLLVAAVLASASAQSVCQTGWTQAPPTSNWGSKCYRELGPPIRNPDATPTVGGYNHSACNVACEAESATARILCLASDAETSFVTKQAYMNGWVAYTQNSSRLDYAEPAGGWGWDCASTYVPTWTTWDSSQFAVQPDNGGNRGEDVSCGFLSKTGMEDLSCQEGDGTLSSWSRSALLNPTPRAFTHQALTTHPDAQNLACARTTRRHQPPPPAWTGASRPVAS